MSSIAWFISSHGFGHVTRSAAVMSAIQKIAPETRFEVFTQSPEWLLRDSRLDSFAYHLLDCDIGLVQTSPLEEDLGATLERLAGFIPFDDGLIQSLAGQVQRLGCRSVVCDIAPLGIAVASRAGIPSILVENFTWDWIYEGYLESEPRFAAYIDYLREMFQSASYHIQTEPVSCYSPQADLLTPPVGRSARLSPQETRLRLGIPPSARMALLTMGGIQSTLTLTQHPDMPADLYFVIPGAQPGIAQASKSIPLPFHSDFYHPDLVAASDVIVGKAGYSTLSEAYNANVPFAFIPRARFRETPSLVNFILNEVGGFEISEEDFRDGTWLKPLSDLLARPRHVHARENGAGQVARFILNI